MWKCEHETVLWTSNCFPYSKIKSGTNASFWFLFSIWLTKLVSDHSLLTSLTYQNLNSKKVTLICEYCIWYLRSWLSWSISTCKIATNIFLKKSYKVIKKVCFLFTVLMKIIIIICLLLSEPWSANEMFFSLLQNLKEQQKPGRLPCSLPFLNMSSGSKVIKV